MMIERAVTEENGQVWSDTVFVIYEDEKPIILKISPDILYLVAKSSFDRLLKRGIENKKQNALSKLIKFAIRGLLIAWGPDMLDLFFGEGNHPNPGKKDDLIEWYNDIFIRYLISEGMRNDTIIEGGREEVGSATIINVLGLVTRPISSPASAIETTGEGTGTGHAEPSEHTV